MNTNDGKFSFGLTYWPRRSGFGLWQIFDRAEVTDDMAQIVALGFDTVRFCLTWEDFQPGPQRINSVALRSLEQALDAAHTAGLRVVLTLFPAMIGGALQIPAWANAPDVINELVGDGPHGSLHVLQSGGGPPILAEQRYRVNQSRDLFGSAAALEAEDYLIGEIAGYFGSHPSIWAWQPGEGLEYVYRPASHTLAHTWFERRADTLRQLHRRIKVLGMVTAHGLSTRSGPRPDDIAAATDLLGVSVEPPARMAGQRRHTSYPAYLHGLAAALAQKPMIVSGLGMATTTLDTPGWREDQAYGRSIQVYIGDQEQQAAFLEAALGRLYKAGAAGIWLAAYADYPEEQARRPPLDQSRYQRTLGLIDASGREKLACEAVRAFARTLREAQHAIRPAGPRQVVVDSERHWRHPNQSFVALWREFNDENPL